MTDVIIAIVPAPGHEGLVAEGPMGERPALLYAVIGGGWLSPGRLDECRIPDGRKALVLYAPGGPKLGMMRAMEALDLAYVVTGKTREGSRVVVIGWRNGGAEEINDVPEEWPDDLLRGADEAFALAHILLQRGLASEVLVLSVTS